MTLKLFLEVEFILFELSLLQSELEPIKTLVIILLMQSVVFVIANLSGIKLVWPYEMINLTGYKKIRVVNKNTIAK